MALSLDEITALLSKPEKGQPAKPPQQYGPLRWYDKEMRCASRGCGSPTHCKVEGIPYCTMHSLRKLNDMLTDEGERNGSS